MTHKPLLALAALTLLTPLSAHAETVTIVKTGEIVTTTYRMPSAPVAGTTEMTTSTIVKDYDEKTTTRDNVIEWRDSQPIQPQTLTPASGINAQARKTFPSYNQ